MSGFDNETVYGKNADFSSVNNQNVLEANGLVTDGKMWIGSTALNGGGTHINVGSLTSPDSSVTVGYSSPNITLQAVSRLVLISSQALSSVASIAFTGLSTYNNYLVVIQYIQPLTNTANFQMLISNDNGATYKTTNYQSGVNYFAYNAATVTNVNSTADIRLSGPLSSATNYAAQLNLTGINSGSIASLTGTAVWNDSGAGTLATTGLIGGNNTGFTAINAIKFQMSSGNINLGKITLYGYKET